MSNMGYCRFQNTASDLEDCYEHLHEELSEEENEARIRIIETARNIVEEMEDEDLEKLPVETN